MFKFVFMVRSGSSVLSLEVELLRRHCHMPMNDLEEEGEPQVSPSVSKLLPSESLEHLGHTTITMVVTTHKPGCSSLDAFKGVNILLEIRVPYGGRVF